VAHDLTGHKFGRLTVIKENGRKHNRIAWLCKCDCGNEITLTSNRLLHKEGTKSCGCIRKETATENATKHGHSNDRIYKIWLGIKKRCFNKNDKNYDRYGGRGIKLCERWLDFMNFYNDMIDTYKDDLTIDRIDYNGDYEPNNCRWITPKEQLSNYSKNVFITINGETDTVKNMCEKYNVPYDCTVRRIKRGIEPYEALTAIYRNGTNEIIGYRQLVK
jgi:hypothetical protein